MEKWLEHSVKRVARTNYKHCTGPLYNATYDSSLETEVVIIMNEVCVKSANVKHLLSSKIIHHNLCT